MGDKQDSGNIVRFPGAVRDENQGRRLFPGRLIEARLASRLNQTDLANIVGVSRQAISAYEQGIKTPEPGTMRLISEALGQPLGFFTKAEVPSFGEFSANFFRKAGADTKRRNMACEVYARWLAQAAFSFDALANYPSVDLPSFEPRAKESLHYDFDEIEDIAEQTRNHFGLGLGPISNVVRLLELKGIILCRLEIPGENIDAFSFWSGGRPFVFLASDKDSAARARYDAAHELGHLVLHRWVGKDEIEDRERLREIEAEADHFAGAFLLPSRSFPNEIYSPRLNAFLDLKLRWKVSIQAMIYRCKDLEIFDELQITNLYKQISFKKWRKVEPYDGPTGLPLENPLLLKKVAELVIGKGVLDRDRLLSDLALSPSTIEQLMGTDPGYLSSPPPISDFEPSLK